MDGDGRVQQVQLKQKTVQQDRALHLMEVSTRALYVPARDLAAVPYVLYDRYMSEHVSFVCYMPTYKYTNYCANETLIPAK